MRAVDLVCKYCSYNIVRKAYLTLSTENDHVIWNNLGFERDERRNSKAFCFSLSQPIYHTKLLDTTRQIIKATRPDSGFIKLCIYMNNVFEYHTWLIYTPTRKCLYSRTIIDPINFDILYKCTEIF